MYDTYLIICSFIRFSGIDPNYKALTKEEVADYMNKKVPIEIITDQYHVVIFHGKAKVHSAEALHKMSEKKECIFIKKNWKKGHPTNGRYLIYKDFVNDIAPINEDLHPMRCATSPEDFEFYRINKVNMPHIYTDNILAKWMLLQEWDILGYIMPTENGFSPNYRLCVKPIDY
jgi:hypothetical protein